MKKKETVKEKIVFQLFDKSLSLFGLLLWIAERIYWGVEWLIIRIAIVVIKILSFL